MSRSQLQENDILISIAGSFGRIAIVSNNILPANINQAIAIVRIRDDRVLLKYIYLILRSDFIIKQTNNVIKGVAQYNLSLGQIGDFKIPLPSKEIQHKIVNEIGEVEIIEQHCKEKTAILKGNREFSLYTLFILIN